MGRALFAAALSKLALTFILAPTLAVAQSSADYQRIAAYVDQAGKPLPFLDERLREDLGLGREPVPMKAISLYAQGSPIARHVAAVQVGGRRELVFTDKGASRSFTWRVNDRGGVVALVDSTGIPVRLDNLNAQDEILKDVVSFWIAYIVDRQRR